MTEANHYQLIAVDGFQLLYEQGYDEIIKYKCDPQLKYSLGNNKLRLCILFYKIKICLNIFIKFTKFTKDQY